MKKLFFLMVAVMTAAVTMAQDAQITAAPAQSTTAPAEQVAPQVRRMLLERAGNTYYYGDLKMRRRAMLDWYAQRNCKVAYDQFRSGYKLANAGWWCLGIGLACDVAGIGCVIGGGVTATQSAASSSSSAATKNLPPLYYAGVGLVWAGSILEIASIPCLIVGYVRMHESVDTYNAHQGYARNPQPYFAIQSGNSGLGLALHF